MRLSADYADYAEEKLRNSSIHGEVSNHFAMNFYLCNLRNLRIKKCRDEVIRRLRRLRRRKTQKQFNSWRDSNHFAMNFYLCNLRNLRIRKCRDEVIRRLRRLRRRKTQEQFNSWRGLKSLCHEFLSV